MVTSALLERLATVDLDSRRQEEYLNDEVEVSGTRYDDTLNAIKYLGGRANPQRQYLTVGGNTPQVLGGRDPPTLKRGPFVHWCHLLDSCRARKVRSCSSTAMIERICDWQLVVSAMRHLRWHIDQGACGNQFADAGMLDVRES